MSKEKWELRWTKLRKPSKGDAQWETKGGRYVITRDLAGYNAERFDPPVSHTCGGSNASSLSRADCDGCRPQERWSKVAGTLKAAKGLCQENYNGLLEGAKRTTSSQKITLNWTQAPMDYWSTGETIYGEYTIRRVKEDTYTYYYVANRVTIINGTQRNAFIIKSTSLTIAMEACMREAERQITPPSRFPDSREDAKDAEIARLRGENEKLRGVRVALADLQVSVEVRDQLAAIEREVREAHAEEIASLRAEVARLRQPPPSPSREEAVERLTNMLIAVRAVERIAQALETITTEVRVLRTYLEKTT